MENRFFVGLDLGQASDYTALSVLEQEWNIQNRRYEYRLRYLDRVRGMPYPEIVTKVSNMMQSGKLMAVEPPRLIVDKTGVGAPVCDLFRTGPIKPVEITITSGQTPSVVPRGFHVPKRDLVFALLSIFQRGVFTAAENMQLAGTLKTELQNFKVKIDPKTAHDSYESWREGAHDDLVLSVSMAAWYGEYKFGRRAKFH